MTERKKGYWTKNDNCSVCKCDMPWFNIGWQFKQDKTKYCPNCGARNVKNNEWILPG